MGVLPNLVRGISNQVYENKPKISEYRPHDYFKPIHWLFENSWSDLQAHNHNHHYLQATLQQKRNKPNMAYKYQTWQH